MRRWTRFRSALVLSSALWVGCELNPTPVMPLSDGSVTPERDPPAPGGSSAAGSAGSTVIVPPEGTGGSSNYGTGAAPTTDPDGGMSEDSASAEGGASGSGGAAPGEGGASNEGGEGGTSAL